MQIAFYKGRVRLFNRLVSWYLRGKYSHCELILRYVPSGLAMCASSSFMDGGVRFKWVELHPDRWDVVEVGGDHDRAYEWLRKHAGQGYDILGLLGFIWRRTPDSQTRWFCNEAVGAMLGHVDPWRFDPCSLAARYGLQP